MAQKIELVEAGVTTGVGIVDNVLVELEERKMITGNYVYIKDALRIAGAFGGLIVNCFIAKPGTMTDKVSGAIALSTFPLALHSIRRLVKEKVVTGAGYGGYVLERAPEQKAPARPMGQSTVITSY
jgi:hypothetical protein